MKAAPEMESNTVTGMYGTGFYECMESIFRECAEAVSNGPTVYEGFERVKLCIHPVIFADLSLLFPENDLFFDEFRPEMITQESGAELSAFIVNHLQLILGFLRIGIQVFVHIQNSISVPLRPGQFVEAIDKG